METNLLVDELANSIMNIIEAETHPLKRKPHKNGIACSEVRKKLDNCEAEKLRAATDKSYLEDIFKTL
mgnify:CR=1 FL=1|tara:strand:+ start:6311 stop:6514 length:204 start_codon:yes stop_codon:yes gene_type:complete